jgi:2-phosphoglycerate kinase
MTDRLSLTNALTDANIDRQKAERIATEIFDAIHDNVATKQDLQHVEAALKSEMRELELRLEARIDRVVLRLGSLIVILNGIVLAAIRYLPHS